MSSLIPHEDQSLITIIPIIAFVQRYLGSISQNSILIVILFNNLTIDHANHLAVVLMQRNPIKLQLLYRNDVQEYIVPEDVVLETALWIILEPFDISKSRFRFKAPQLTIDMGFPCPTGSEPKFIKMNKQQFTAELDSSIIERVASFRVWNLAQCKNKIEEERLKNIMVEGKLLLESYFWRTFLQRVDRLPKGEGITGVEDVSTNVLRNSGVQLLRHQGTLYLYGYRVAMVKLLAKRLLNGGSLRYQPIIRLRASQAIYPKPLNVSIMIDARLSVPFSFRENQSYKFKISFNTQFKGSNFKTVNYGALTRFVVLVPRVAVSNVSIVWREIRSKILVVGCLLLAATLLATFRFFFDCFVGGKKATAISLIMKTMVDTLSRSLGNSGSRQSRLSMAQNILLLVIGFFGYLASCTMSSYLYERLIDVNELSYIYRNLNDVCEGRLNLLVHQNLAPIRDNNSLHNMSLRVK